MQLSDILWYNSSTGEIQVWLMNGAQVHSTETVLGTDGKPAFIGPPFSIVGVGDFNRDGFADILWHNSSTGEIQVWLMNGAQVHSTETVLGTDGKPTFIGPPFSIVGVGAYHSLQETPVTMTKLIDNGALGAKVTMVVIGDGFTDWDQDEYNRHVDTLLTNGVFTHDFYSVNRSAFDLVRMNVLSNQSGVSTKTYDSNGNVTASTTSDTYFGAIFNGDWAHCWVEDGPNTNQRLNDLLNQWVPDRRLVFLLLNNPGFGGCGGGGRLTLPLGVTWSTVAHECGHALGGLADEYHQGNDVYTGDEPGQPNITANTDRATLKWGSAVAASTPIPTGADDYTPPKPAGWDDNQGVGLFEGGSGNFATGIYRPVIDCRMKTNDPPFCPVCNAAMTAQTNPFLGTAPTGGTGVTPSSPSDGYVRMQVRLQDGKLSVLDAHEVDGPLVQPDTLTYGLVHEVLVEGQRVAVGAHLDAKIARSFEEPGHGPGGHHSHDLGTVDLTIRVPTVALRGVDPAKVTVSIHDVLEHPTTALAPLATLADQPTLKLAPQASVALDQVELPDALRSLMAAK